MDAVYAALRQDPEMWRLFVKEEEYGTAGYDKQTRFVSKASKFTRPEIPTVSEYLTSQGWSLSYPDDAPFAVVVSHDVDDTFVHPRQLAFGFANGIRHRQVKPFVQLTNGFLHPRKSPYRTVKIILSIEQKYDVHSSFYFLASPSDDAFGRKYTLDEVEGDMKAVLDAGSEVGFHTGYYSYDNPNEILRQKRDMEAVLGSRVSGARNHFMRFRTPRTWHVLADAGFQYDSTYGYADVVGFRNGMAHPFLPFDRTTNQPIPILEVPVMVQDWVMLYWMKLSPQQSFERVRTLMDTVQRCHGVLTILWHNWSFANPVSFGGFFSSEWTTVYDKILAEARSRKAWVTDSRTLVNYVASRKGLLRQVKNVL